MSISCWHPATHLHFFPIWAHRGVAMPRACPRETRCSRHRSGLANHNHHHQLTPAFSICWVLFSIFNWEVVWRYNMFVPKTALGMPKVTSKFWGYGSKTILKKTPWMNAWPRREFEEHYFSSFVTVSTPQLCSSVLPPEKASLARFLQVLPPGADCGGFDARKIPTCSPLPLLLCTPTRHHTTRLPTNWTQATKTEPVIRTNSCTFGTSYKLVSQILFHRWGSH